MTTTTLALVLALLATAMAASVAMAPIWRRRARRRLDSGPGGSLLHVLSTPGPVPPSERHRMRRVARRLWRHPAAARWGPVLAAGVCVLIGLIAAGAVAAAVLGAYGAAGFVLIRGVAIRRSQQRAYRLASDAVVGLAADLRAGASLAPAWRVAEQALREARAGVLPGRRPNPWRQNRTGGEDRSGLTVIENRLAAAAVLAEASGAPLAEVLDRLDVHLRAVDRARAVASSQAAGARVSAGLLAVMPLAGVGLGVAVGVDPWRVLLHTTLGAAALCLAVALQLAGLVWAARLAETRVAL